MTRLIPTRILLLLTGALCLAVPLAGAQAVREQPPAQRKAHTGNHHGGSGDHLAAWMAKHSNLSNEQQLQALQG
ncbi:MAG: hypothetical protein ABI142_00665, partial [Bryocella sp.]